MKTRLIHRFPEWDSVRKMILLYLLLPVMLLLFLLKSHGQSCTVNSGISVSTCGTTATLTGNVNGNTAGSPVWNFVSGPITPVIASPGSLTTNVSGMTQPGNYVFRITQVCQLGGTVYQDVTVTTNPEPPGFAITNPAIMVCNNYAAVHNLSATPLPPGWTGRWTAHLKDNGNDVTNQFTFSSPATPFTTAQLVPAQQTCGNRGYFFRWTITSPNGLCTYNKSVDAYYYPDINQLSYNTTPVSICGPGSASIASTSCGTWSAYLPVSYTVSPLSVPAGFTGSLSATNGGGGLVISGLTIPGAYTFNVRINFTGCGTSKTFGPFTINTGIGLPVYNFTGIPANFCLTSAPASVTFHFTVADPTVISYLEFPIPNFTYSITGTGTSSRSITFTPVSGWTAGAFRFVLRFRHASNPPGTCEVRAVNGLYIYDGNPPAAITIANSTACIPVNSTSAAGTINLPNLNVSYLGPDFGWQQVWTFEKLSGPAGGSISDAGINAATANYWGLTAGTYTFRAKLIGTGNRILEELACSGGFTPPTFTITVYNQQGANAGTSQNIVCIQLHPLAANAPIAPSIGTWSLVSGPSPMQFSNVNNPDASVSIWTTHANAGTYVFRWTISDPSGRCPAVSSDVTITSSTRCNYLPVNLASFTAAPVNGSSLLKWTTATEQNLRVFSVEWSTDAISWKEEGSVPAQGGSGKTDYNFTHQRPGPGVNYYRLKMVDIDGRFSYSAIVSVRFDRSASVEVIPNPARDNLYIYNLKKGDQVRLISMAGITERTLTATEPNITIRIASLSPGLYILQVSGNGQEQARQFKIVKQ